MPYTIYPRRTTRPGWTPANVSQLLERELLVNVADARIWIVVDGQEIELRAADADAQRAAVNAMDRGLLIRDS